MKIIDGHIHTCFEEKQIEKRLLKNKTDFSMKGLQKEMKEAGITKAVAISCNLEKETPICLKHIKKQIRENKNLAGICGVNPFKITKKGLEKTEKALCAGTIKGLKIFSGYYHISPNSSVYLPIYKLANKTRSTVIFHTGDTITKDGLLKYSAPLPIDEVAVKFPKAKFVIAHLGNPWIDEAAAIAYKNDNVYIDLSAFFVGEVKKAFFNLLKPRLLYAFEYIDNYDKVIYGSDWPNINLKLYLETMKKIIPMKHWKKVFYKNACQVYGMN